MANRFIVQATKLIISRDKISYNVKKKAIKLYNVKMNVEMKVRISVLKSTITLEKE